MEGVCQGQAKYWMWIKTIRCSIVVPVLVLFVSAASQPPSSRSLYQKKKQKTYTNWHSIACGLSVVHWSETYYPSRVPTIPRLWVRARWYDWSTVTIGAPRAMSVSPGQYWTLVVIRQHVHGWNVGMVSCERKYHVYCTIRSYHKKRIRLDENL